MFAIGEYDQFVFTQKFSSIDYFFVYNNCDNNAVHLIHPTPDIADTLEDFIPDENFLHNMVDDMMETM